MRLLMIISFFSIGSLCLADSSSHHESKPPQNHQISPKATLTPSVQIGVNAFKFSKVRSYEGYFMNGVMYGDEPGFSILYESGDRNASGKLDIDQERLTTISPSVSNEIIDENRNFLTGFQNFVQSDVVRAGVITVKGMKLIRYNYLDANRNVRLSVWHDEDSGFQVQRAIYDESGLLRTFKIYLRLDIEKPRFGKPRHFKKLKFHKRYRFTRHMRAKDDLKDLRDTGEQLLREILD